MFEYTINCLYGSMHTLELNMKGFIYDSVICKQIRELDEAIKVLEEEGKK